MRKIVALLLVLVMVLALLVLLNVIGVSASTYMAGESDIEYVKEDLTEYETGESDVEYVKEDLTEYEIEQFVVEALYDEIDSKFSMADAGSCRYDINKTEEKGNYVYVYGTVWLYDKYGQLTTGFFDNSGSSMRSFEVIIHQDGYIKDCEIGS